MPDLTDPTPAGDRDAYLARPDGAGPWPGVLLIHEIFGPNGDIRALTDRCAAMGYLALAPDYAESADQVWRRIGGFFATHLRQARPDTQHGPYGDGRVRSTGAG